MSESTADTEELFAHDEFKVTPTWLVVDSTSFAVRYISKLSLSKIDPPRLSAYAVIFVVFLLGLFTIYKMVSGVWPHQYAWWGLVACVLTALYALYVAILIPDKVMLEVKFSSGETIELTHKQPQVMLSLHEALTVAMSMHNKDDVNVQRYDSMSIV